MPSERPSRAGLAGMGPLLISVIVVAAGLIVAMVGGALSGVVNSDGDENCCSAVDFARSGLERRSPPSPPSPSRDGHRRRATTASSSGPRGRMSTAMGVTLATTSCAATSRDTSSRGAPTAASSCPAPSSTPTPRRPLGSCVARTPRRMVQIDHVVALSDAWQKGAQQLSAESRRALANDSLNLLAVDGLTNQRKSDGDAATWLPPNKAYRCSVCRTAGRGESEVRALGHQRRARRARADPGDVSVPAAAGHHRVCSRGWARDVGGSGVAVSPSARQNCPCAPSAAGRQV